MHIQVSRDGFFFYDGHHDVLKAKRLWPFTVASQKDDQMSETMIANRNLPNPHLFEHFFYTHT